MEKSKKATTTVEVIGMLAVVLSLVFVGYEVRQNTKQMRTEASDTITERVNMMNAGIYSDSALASIILRGEQDRSSLDSVETMQFDMFQLSRLNLAEYILDLEEEEIRDLSFDFIGFVIHKFKSSPGLQQFVQQYAPTYRGSPEFISQLKN